MTIAINKSVPIIEGGDGAVGGAVSTAAAEQLTERPKPSIKVR